MIDRWTRMCLSTSVLTMVVGALTLIACAGVAAILGEPVPAVHDEFSYLLASNTFGSGVLANPPPPLWEFFDTFHVLLQPVYASKYPPGQGLFLSLGERLTGHPIVGVWCSAACACAATCWMLRSWVGPGWAFLGSLLMVVQVGAFSYWSQSYWGGMVAALGGALYFGAVRRMWDCPSALAGFWLATGLLILANSRPVEGLVSALPVGAVLVSRLASRRSMTWARYKGAACWFTLVLLIGGVWMARYNRATTGSVMLPAYLLHERQYQSVPQFTILGMGAPRNYSSAWVKYLYDKSERALYDAQRTLAGRVEVAADRLVEWWRFYWGLYLSIPVILSALADSRVRKVQLAVLVAGVVSVCTYVVHRPLGAPAVVTTTVAQLAVLLWSAEDLWRRVAIGTVALGLGELFVVKAAFPHYFAPATCLIVLLQTDGLRSLWCGRGAGTVGRDGQRREIASAIVALLVLSVSLQLVARSRGAILQVGSGATAFALPATDWSHQRIGILQRLRRQPGRHLVFVHYSDVHNVNAEWVFNHANVMNASVVWARDLGDGQNRRLLAMLPHRQTWLLVADLPEPLLVPYSDAGSSPAESKSPESAGSALPW